MSIQCLASLAFVPPIDSSSCSAKTGTKPRLQVDHFEHAPLLKIEQAKVG